MKWRTPSPLSLSVLALIVLAIGWYLMVMFSSPTPPRHAVERALCVNQMRLLDRAKQVWAEENHATNGQVIGNTPQEIWEQLNPCIAVTNALCCPKLPRGSHYIYGPIGTVPKCPYGKDHVYEPD